MKTEEIDSLISRARSIIDECRNEFKYTEDKIICDALDTADRALFAASVEIESKEKNEK